MGCHNTEIMNTNHLYILTKFYPREAEDHQEAMMTNPTFTWSIVEDNPNISWDYALLSAQACVTWQLIKDNPQLKWSIANFSSNPTLYGTPLSTTYSLAGIGQLSQPMNVLSGRW